MPLTLGLTGMDPATEAALKAAFIEANARLGDRWTLVPDADAVHVVVDMDSMYGPMSWLRLHAAGRQVIGLTSASRTQTDYRLGRPFDVAQLTALLSDVARGSGIELQGVAAAPAVAAADAAAPVVAPPPLPETPAAARDVPVADSPSPAGTGSEAAIPAAVTAPPAAAVAAEPPASDPAGRTLAEWLQPGALSGRVRIACADGPALFIDATGDSWHGPATLKAIAPCFAGRIADAAIETPDADTWDRDAAAAGAPQALARLRWMGGLLAGGGELLPGLDPVGRFQLNKWPQTEREYPRHFRIATQMMKGPATMAEIAAASGVPVADVADFINANLATGFAEPVVDAAPAADEPAKSRGGLLGRLRSR